MLQYFKFVHQLGLQHSKLAKTILGSAFEWNDILAYFIGALLILAFEYVKSSFLVKNKNS